MTWKERLTARILLIIAMMVSEGEIHDELVNLRNHIMVHGGEESD